MDTVETKEPEEEGSDLTVLLVPDFALLEGPGPEGFLLIGAFFWLGASGVGIRYLYSVKSGSPSLSNFATT